MLHDNILSSSFPQGGWAEVDSECAMTGKLQIPVGMTWNQTTDDGQHLSRLSDKDAEGGIVFAWHSQTWAMHMFQIASATSSEDAAEGIDQFFFEKGGGKQGGE